MLLVSRVHQVREVNLVRGVTSVHQEQWEAMDNQVQLEILVQQVLGEMSVSQDHPVQLDRRGHQDQEEIQDPRAHLVPEEAKVH